jgi:hypothetical protein
MYEQQLLMPLADELAFVVQRRMMICCDLVAAETVYHRKCHTDFFSVLTEVILLKFLKRFVVAGRIRL